MNKEPAVLWASMAASLGVMKAENERVGRPAGHGAGSLVVLVASRDSVNEPMEPGFGRAPDSVPTVGNGQEGRTFKTVVLITTFTKNIYCTFYLSNCTY
jgi:hypothetical protein